DAVRTAGAPTGRRIAEYGLLGLGVGGLAFGTVELLRFSSKNDEIAQTCGVGLRCPTPEAHASYLSLRDEATTARTMSWVGFGVGGAALVTSAVLVLTEPSSRTAASEMGTFVPIVGVRGSGVAWERAW